MTENKPKKLRYLPLLLCLLLLSGCAGLSPDFESPRVSLADIRVQEVKTLETAFLVELRVMNPNQNPLEVDGLSCDIELEGRRFASGMQSVQQTIPPYGSTLVPVEVYASVLDMVGSVIGLLQSTTDQGTQLEGINYRLAGKVRVSSGGISRNLPFESEGELRLQ